LVFAAFYAACPASMKIYLDALARKTHEENA